MLIFPMFPPFDNSDMSSPKRNVYISLLFILKYNSRLECKIDTLFTATMFQIHTLFMTKTAEIHTLQGSQDL